MHSKIIDSTAAPTYVLVLDPGDEAIAVITAFAREQSLTAAQVTAIGAFEQATVGWFDRVARQYRPIDVPQQCEVLSLIGDIAAAAAPARGPWPAGRQHPRRPPAERPCLAHPRSHHP